MLIAERKHGPEDASDSDPIISVITDSDSQSSGNPQRRTEPRICVLVGELVRRVNSLYDLSVSLRIRGAAHKAIQSIQPTPLDEAHVAKKITQWRGLTKATRCIGSSKEEVATTEAGEPFDVCNIQDISWFCQRLARANTRRREQLQYWAHHPVDSQKNKLTFIGSPSRHFPETSVEPVEEVKESGSHVSGLESTDGVNMGSGQKTAVSRQSSLTITVSAVEDTESVAPERTVLSPTSNGNDRSMSVPESPKPEDGSSTFACPYCGMMLDHGEMNNKQSWK